MPGSRLCIALLVAAALGLGACGGCEDQPRSAPLKRASAPSGSATASSSSSSAPAAGACGDPAMVACADRCCPAGTTCASGGCGTPLRASDLCNSGEVLCSGPAPCPGGECRGFDASTEENHASVRAPAAFGEGRFGGGLWPNPEGVSCPAGVAAAPVRGLPAGSFTVEAWVRVQANLIQALVTYGSHPFFQWMLYSTGTHLNFAGCTENYLHQDAWHFVAAVYRAGPPASVSLYVDGRPPRTCDNVPVLPAPPDGASVVFGDNIRSGPNNCTPLHGQLDEVRILSRALESSEVALDAAAGGLSPTADTVGLWHFDEGSPGRCCPAGAGCSADGSCGGTSPSQSADCNHIAWSPCAGGCCGPGRTCASEAGRVVCKNSDFFPRNRDPGPRCASGEFCSVNQVCGGAASCCPAAYPAGCGEQCCADAALCADGVCGCGAGEQACGGWCCEASARCTGGTCFAPCADPAFPTACGESCCASGLACQNGLCRCPAAHPLGCGEQCCLVGAPCQAGVCGCPDGRAVCGDQCCASGKSCVEGACKSEEEEPPPGCGGGGPGGVPEGGACDADAECAGDAICVSSRNCTVSVFSGTCSCAGSTAGQCADFVARGIQVTRCGDCGPDFSACCPGQICVQGTCKSACP